MKRFTLLLLFSFITISFCACQQTVSSKNIKVNIANNSYKAIYTGTLENGKPTGSGEIEITDYKIDFDGTSLIGNYKGNTLNGIPDGEGEFTSTSDDYSFSYSGFWKDGIISGEGNLKYDKYIVHFSDVNREGNYVGATLDGKASGYGIFKAENDYGEKYTHDGQWANGLPNGYGRRYFENGSYDYTGTFTDGEFDPTLTNLLCTLANSDDDLSFNLSDEEIEFIEKNEFLFPTDNMETLALYLDTDINYKMLEKNESAYNDALMLIEPAYVISIEELDGIIDKPLSMLLISDIDDNVHCIYYPDHAEDIYSEDIIGCVAYPVGFSSYENIQGTRTKCTVLLGCFITEEE